MTRNFKILASQTNDMLHLELTGDFDESSAVKLLKILRENSNGIDGICVHAGRLKRINPYGRKIIKKNLSWINSLEPYVFITGGNLGQTRH